MVRDEERKLHHEICYVGLRAQATAVGLLQLCIELRDAGVLEENAVGRIKEAIAGEIALSGPRSMTHAAYGREVRARLDKLFAGREKVGKAEVLAFAAGES